MKRTKVKNIARLVMGLACVFAFTTTNLGCACMGKKCKPGCKQTAGCKEGCQKPCCKKKTTAANCPPGCTKPCCKKA